jgi:hypothetical protein
MFEYMMMEWVSVFEEEAVITIALSFAVPMF